MKHSYAASPAITQTKEHLMSMIKSFLKNESGVTAAEYALVLAFLVIALGVGLTAAATNIKAALTTASASL